MRATSRAPEFIRRLPTTKGIRVLALLACVMLPRLSAAQSLSNIQFAQVNWFGSQAPAILDSEWGEFSVDIAPGVNIQYINVIASNANGMGGPDQWIVRNLPTLPVSSDPSTQSFVTTFDLGLLGIARGENASTLDYGITVDSTPRTSPPSGPPTVFGVSVGDVTVDAEGKGPDGPLQDPGSPPNLSTLNFTLGTIHFHWQLNVPNFDLENMNAPGDYDGCAPAAVTNSLKWLGVADPLRDIFDDVSAAMGRVPFCAPGCANAGANCTVHANCLGCPATVIADFGGGCIGPATADAATIAGKLKYIDDNRLGFVVKFQDDVFGGANFVTPQGTAVAKGLVPTFPFIEKELDDDEDVEMGFTFYRCDESECLRDGNADGIVDIDAGTACTTNADCDALAAGDKLGVCGEPECEVNADCNVGDCVSSGGHFVTVVGKLDLGFAQGLWTKDDRDQVNAGGTRTKFGWLRTRGDGFLETTAFHRNKVDIVVTESPRDHYKLYETLGPDGPAVNLVDQFDVRCVGGTNDGAVCKLNSECPVGTCTVVPETPDLGRLVFLANPVAKTCVSGCEPSIINNPDEHLVFHVIPEEHFGPVAVVVDNQFGPQTLTVGNPRLLAVPSQKSIQPDPLPPAIQFTINHYKCYDADGDPPDLNVALDDQFGHEDVRVGSPFLFCNPVDKNNEGILDPDGHLTCYQITDTAAPFDVDIRNQFGETELTTGNPAALCVPSRKLSVAAPTATPPAPCPTPTPVVTPTPLRHFECYEEPNAAFPTVAVSLVDRFGPSTVNLTRRKRICNPADKNGEDPSAPFDPNHLTGYLIKQTSPRFVPLTGVTVTNQFGTIVIDLAKPDYLLVPAAKSQIGPPGPLANPAVDHFKCYKVRKGRTRVAGINLTDQFGSFTFDVKRPLRFCVAVDKNGEGIRDPSAALMCYKGRQTSLPRFRGIAPIFIDDQFGAATTSVDHLSELCVPSVIPCGDGITSPGEQCDPPDFPAGRCGPPNPLPIPCLQNSDCDTQPGNGVCVFPAGCGPDQVCDASCRCKDVADFCAEDTPIVPPGPAMKLCVFPPSEYGTPCGVNADCDSNAGAGDGICNPRQHRGKQRPLQGGWNALNAIDVPVAATCDRSCFAGAVGADCTQNNDCNDPPNVPNGGCQADNQPCMSDAACASGACDGIGTLGSFPKRDADDQFVSLSNNHVFARSSGNISPPVAILGETINQPPVGFDPAAGPLADYEWLCFSRSCTEPADTYGDICNADADCDDVGGDGVCSPAILPACPAAGGLNQINRVGGNCMDAAIASTCPAGAAVLDNGDILDVGAPTAFPSVPLPPATCAGPTPLFGNVCTTDADCGSGFCDQRCDSTLSMSVIHRIVKKSGARTGFTCGRITAIDDDTIPYPVCTAPPASVGNDCEKNEDCETAPGNGVCQQRPARFRNQWVIRGLPGFEFNGHFSCSGDSGSLILGVATNKPIGLLFAGNAGACKPPGGSDTVANPIDIVLGRFKGHF
jgi:hypothetical protein